MTGSMPVIIVFIVAFLVGTIALDLYSGEDIDKREQAFKSYLSVCENQAGYSVGRCLFAWQYPVEAAALSNTRK
mgnify:CR=1 FL=1